MKLHGVLCQPTQQVTGITQSARRSSDAGHRISFSSSMPSFSGMKMSIIATSGLTAMKASRTRATDHSPAWRQCQASLWSGPRFRSSTRRHQRQGIALPSGTPLSRLLGRAPLHFCHPRASPRRRFIRGSKQQVYKGSAHPGTGETVDRAFSDLCSAWSGTQAHEFGERCGARRRWAGKARASCPRSVAQLHVHGACVEPRQKFDLASPSGSLGLAPQSPPSSARACAPGGSRCACACAGQRKQDRRSARQRGKGTSCAPWRGRRIEP